MGGAAKARREEVDRRVAGIMAGDSRGMTGTHVPCQWEPGPKDTPHGKCSLTSAPSAVHLMLDPS